MISLAEDIDTEEEARAIHGEVGPVPAPEPSVQRCRPVTGLDGYEHAATRGGDLSAGEISASTTRVALASTTRASTRSAAFEGVGRLS